MSPRLSRLLLHLTRWIPAVALITVVLALAGLPTRTTATYAARTAAGERWQESGFAVAVVWPKRDRPAFVEGAQLALDDINRAAGPLAGKVRLRFYTEQTVPQENGLAMQVARAGDVMAVIGHAVTEHVVPASLVYERHAMLFITPQATDPRSTNHRFQYVFRLTPNDEQIADALVRFAQRRGFARVGVLYARTEHGEASSRAFIAKATQRGMQGAFHRSYHSGRGDWHQQDFRPLAADVRSYQFDAVLIADTLPVGGKLVRDLVQMGVTQPILATDKFDPLALSAIAGAAAKRVHIATAFDPSSPTPAYRAFRTRFIQRYGLEPSYEAAQGYEAFMLVARAAEQSRTAAPLVLATTIRLAPGWQGLFGEFAFHKDGDLVGRPIAIAHLQDGRAQTEYTWTGDDE